MPGWVRTAEIVLGLVSLFAGALVIAYPGLGFFTLEVILAVGLIFLGSRLRPRSGGHISAQMATRRGHRLRSVGVYSFSDRYRFARSRSNYLGHFSILRLVCPRSRGNFYGTSREDVPY